MILIQGRLSTEVPPRPVPKGVASEGKTQKSLGTVQCGFFFFFISELQPPSWTERKSPKVLLSCRSSSKAHPGPAAASALFWARCTFTDPDSGLWHCLSLLSKYVQVPSSNFRKVKFAKVQEQTGLLFIFISLENYNFAQYLESSTGISGTFNGPLTFQNELMATVPFLNTH